MFFAQKTRAFPPRPSNLPRPSPKLDVPALVQLGVSLSSKEVYEYRWGEVRLKPAKTHEPGKRQTTAQLVG